MERASSFESLLLYSIINVRPTNRDPNMAIFIDTRDSNTMIDPLETNVPVNSKTAHPPPPRAIPGHLTRVKLRTVGNLTKNEAHPVGHLAFVSKRLSAVGSKRISQFFHSAREPRSRVISLVDSTWVFLLLSFYVVISFNMPLFKVWLKI